MQPYRLWIEAEAWVPGSWEPLDTNSDVIVTFADGSRWAASFFTYATIATLVAGWKQTGECLHGAYVWASDMILIDEVSRSQIEKVVIDFLEMGIFRDAFTRMVEHHDAGSDSKAAL